MGKATEVTLDSIANVVAQENLIKQIKGQSKELTDQKHTAKVTAYSELLAEFVVTGVRVSKAGNLPTAVSRALKNQLEAEGINKATYDRYVQNTAGLLAHEKVGKQLQAVDHNNAVSEVLWVLDQNGLSSENKIEKFWKTEVQDLIDKAAKAAAKKRYEIYLEDEKELVRFDELTAQYFDAFKAEAEKKALEEAKTTAEENAEAINSFTDDLDLAS